MNYRLNYAFKQGKKKLKDNRKMVTGLRKAQKQRVYRKVPSMAKRKDAKVVLLSYYLKGL